MCARAAASSAQFMALFVCIESRRTPSSYVYISLPCNTREGLLTSTRTAVRALQEETPTNLGKPEILIGAPSSN